MALFKQTFVQSGSNAAAITKGSVFVGMLNVRMTDEERDNYGACNSFRFVNKSALKIRVRWGLGNETNGGGRFDDIEAFGILNLTVEDGILAYGFDVMNLDAATDVAIGEFHYSMSKIKQIPEK